MGGATFASLTTQLDVTGLPAGQYAVIVPALESPDALSRYAASPSSFELNVSGNQTIPVSFHVAYWVAVSVVGPGGASVLSGWVNANATLSLSAVPSPNSEFVSWTGNGTGSYAGPSPRPSLP